jgi:hypothetical protein
VETHRNIEYLAAAPSEARLQDIADFRHDNRTAFWSVFREFVLLCRQLDLFGRELLAVDRTRPARRRGSAPCPQAATRTGGA